MKLYIRQKVFSWREKFTVKDENAQDRDFVEGEFSWAKKLHIYRMDGSEAAYIEGKLWSWTPQYKVFVGGEQIAEVVREFSFFKPRYRIDGPGWLVSGDFWEHDYEIVRDGQRIAGICKEWMSWGDCYELDVDDETEEIRVLAVALAIDCALAAAAAASSC